MRTEKILTVYPTIVKGGLAVVPLMPPDPLIFSNKFPIRCKFYLTSLMYFCRGKQYTTEIDVLFNGMSVLPDQASDENTMETFMFSPIDDENMMVGTTLYVNNLNLNESGSYDVIFRIYEEIDGKLGAEIDEKTCTIIAAEAKGASS